MVICTNCKRPYPETGAPYRCPTCGGLYDYDAPFIFDPQQVDRSQPGIWRYRHSFGLPEAAPALSLGEGQTPLVWSDALGKQVAFKLELSNPSGSFKDRGSSTMLSFLCTRGVREAVEDSSGNAGASFAAYAARAGIKAHVYVPDSSGGPKRKQIEAYGAKVTAVAGPRSNAGEAATRAARQGEYYASHAYLPFNLPGYATAAFEIYEQLGQAPGMVISPVGQGGLLLGMSRGFTALKNAGLIERMPQLVGVQARACAPLFAVASYGGVGLQLAVEAPTLAEGVRVKHPLRGDALLIDVEASGGTFLAVGEEDILPGRDLLARRGLYVEPTSAIVWDALTQIGDRLVSPAVVMLTGSGLKYSG